MTSSQQLIFNAIQNTLLDPKDAAWVAFKERMQDPEVKAALKEETFSEKIFHAYEESMCGDRKEAQYMLADIYNEYCHEMTDFKPIFLKEELEHVLEALEDRLRDYRRFPEEYYGPENKTIMNVKADSLEVFVKYLKEQVLK